MNNVAERRSAFLEIMFVTKDKHFKILNANVFLKNTIFIFGSDRKLILIN